MIAGPERTAISRRFRQLALARSDRGDAVWASPRADPDLDERFGSAVTESLMRLSAQPFAAALFTAATMSAGEPLPANMLTTPPFRALPTFWPYWVSSHSAT